MNYIDTHKLLYRYPDMEKKAAQDKNQIKDTDMNYIDVQTLRRNAEMHMYKKADAWDNAVSAHKDFGKALLQGFNPRSTWSYAGKRIGHRLSDLANFRLKDALLGRKDDTWVQHLISRGKLDPNTRLRYDALMNGFRGSRDAIKQDFGDYSFKNRHRANTFFMDPTNKPAPAAAQQAAPAAPAPQAAQVPPVK